MAHEWSDDEESVMPWEAEASDLAEDMCSLLNDKKTADVRLFVGLKNKAGGKSSSTLRTSASSKTFASAESETLASTTKSLRSPRSPAPGVSSPKASTKPEAVFYAHRAILSARSPVLRSQLQETKDSTLRFPGMQAAAFEEALKFVYGGVALTRIDSLSAPPLLGVSKALQLRGLEDATRTFFHRRIGPENACSLLQAAVDTNDTELINHCSSYVCNHASECVSGGNLGALARDTLIDLVSSDSLDLRELSVFHAVVTWGREQRPGTGGGDTLADTFRSTSSAVTSVSIVSAAAGFGSSKPATGTVSLQDLIAPVLEHVRFPLISASDLLREVKPLGVVSNELLLEAMEFHAAPTESDSGGCQRFKPRSPGSNKLGRWAAHPFCALSRHGATIRKRGPPAWDVVAYTEAGVRVGVHSFRLKLDFLHKDTHGVSFGLQQLGADPTSCHASAGMYNGAKAEGDVFEVRVDFSKPATITFFRNGTIRYMTKGFDTSQDLYFCVCLYHPDIKVSLMK